MNDQVEQIGRYIVVTRIGSGGFATVYRVRDSNLGREVALKVMRPLLLSDPSFVKRFEQEARVIANLDHPNIVPIYDYGDIEDRLCLVMKLLPGGSLGDLIRRGPIPWDRVVEITTQISAALDYAHERGLVHRDIKPENVLLDDDGNAVLADFGLVRALESGRLTTSLSGGVLGTPAYVAPEVWNGDAGTPTTDVYGLACLVYEMITGTQLFDAPTPPATMTLHFRPPQFPPGWPEGTPPGIERVLRQALAHDPAQRYPSAGAFATDLAALATDALAGPYAALEAAVAAEKWNDAIALGETIVNRAPGYRNARELLARATAARVNAERSAWAAQWQAEAESALENGDWQRALTAAQRWKEFAPDDAPAQQAIERAQAKRDEALQPPVQPGPGAAETVVEESPSGTTIAGQPEETVQEIDLAPARSSEEVPSPTLPAPAVEKQPAKPQPRTTSPEPASAPAAASRLKGYRWGGLGEEPAEPVAAPRKKSPLARLAGLPRWQVALLALLALGAVYLIVAFLLSRSPNDGSYLAIGDSYEGRLGMFNTSDNFQLADLAGELVEVEVASGSSFDAVMTVYDASNNLVVRLDKSGSGGTERLIFEPDGGYVHVEGYSGDNGAYNVRVYQAPESGMLYRAVSGELTIADDFQLYPFSTPGQGARPLKALATGDFDLILEIQNLETGEVLSSYDSGGAEYAEFYPPEEASAETGEPFIGNYAFVIRGYSGQTGTYHLALVGPENTVFELGLGEEVVGAFGEAGLFEFSFILAPGQSTAMEVLPDEGTDVAVRIGDLDGNLLAETDDAGEGGAEWLPITAPAGASDPGTYRLSVVSVAGGGRFKLHAGAAEEEAGTGSGEDLNVAHYDSDALGLQFDYPAGWPLQEASDDNGMEPFQVGIASDQQILSGENELVTGAAVGFLVEDGAAYGDESLDAVFEQHPVVAGILDSAQPVAGPEETSINGIDAYTATFEEPMGPSGDVLGQFKVVLAQQAERLVLIALITPVEELDVHAGQFSLILDSVELRPPSEAIGNGTENTGKELSPFEPTSLLNPEGCGGNSRIERIDAPDRYTVAFSLCEPDPAFLARLAIPAFAIASDEYLEATGGTGDLLTHPIGTGPYRFEEWDQGNEILFARNEDYWDEPAATAQLIIRWTEPAGRLAALQAGEADGIDTPDNTDAVINDPALQLLERPAAAVLYLGMNNRAPPFGDLRVRQAIAVGIDRQRLIDNYFLPGATVATHFAPCVLESACLGESWYDYDPELGRQLLAEAGYPDGFQTTIFIRDVPRSYLAHPLDMANDLQAQLMANLGVDATVVVQESPEFLGAIFDGTIDGIYLLGWLADYAHASGVLEAHFATTNLQFGDPYTDIIDVLAAASSTVDSAPLYAQANDLIRDLVPLVPLAHAGNTVAFRSDVNGAYASAFWLERFAQMQPDGRDTFVWIQNIEPSSLYCADDPTLEAWRACAQVMETLVRYDESAQSPAPLLAHGWQVSEDGLLWTFYLQEGVTFHDGTPFDANDVVTTFAVGLDRDNPRHIGNSGEFGYYDSMWGQFGGQ